MPAPAFDLTTSLRGDFVLSHDGHFGGGWGKRGRGSSCGCGGSNVNLLACPPPPSENKGRRAQRSHAPRHPAVGFGMHLHQRSEIHGTHEPPRLRRVLGIVAVQANPTVGLGPEAGALAEGVQTAGANVTQFAAHPHEVGTGLGRHVRAQEVQLPPGTHHWQLGLRQRCRPGAVQLPHAQHVPQRQEPQAVGQAVGRNGVKKGQWHLTRNVWTGQCTLHGTWNLGLSVGNHKLQSQRNLHTIPRPLQGGG